MSECRDLKGSAVRSVVLGIKLAGATAANREAIANQVLSDEKVRKALHEAFRTQARAITQAQLSNNALDGAAARKFLQPLRKAAPPLALAAVKKQPEFNEARAGLNKLKCAFDATPVGVFVDDNKTWLIIAGVVLGAAGAVAMYKLKSGDIPASGMALLANQAADKIELGDVVLGVKDVAFKPSTGSAKGKLKLDLSKLHTVKIKQQLEIASAVKAGKLTELMVSESVVIPLAPSLQLKGSAAGGVRDSQAAYDFALMLKRNSKGGLDFGISAFARGQGPEHTHGMKATVGMPLDSSRLLGPQSRTTIGGIGTLERTRGPGNTGYQTSGSVQLGLTATFF